MTDSIQHQINMFPYRLSRLLRKKPVYKDGVYAGTTYPTIEETVKYINSTDVLGAIIFTDEQRELLAKYRDRVNVTEIMSDALTKELKNIHYHILSAQSEQDRLARNPARILKPEVGDQWKARFGSYGDRDFIVMQVFGEDDIVVWGNHLMEGNDPNTGYLRVSRQWIVGHTHADCGQECRLTDLDPRMWGMDCHPMPKDSEDYKSLIEHNTTYDYSSVESILRG